ncbi:MAG TPA: SGNH/GDSL hydrolase family protein [Hyphomonadaceae bacterium]|jgi:lysophospholipase L1-like esterase|nr:SGNH/GDSL hydrolase family protein [Hyphomonadaceae bacterium]
MKHLAAVLTLSLAACSTATPPATVLPPVSALAGTPCDPPLAVPASIIASVRSRFEEGATPPAITEADRAAYTSMGIAQSKNDWANLCYFRADNAKLAVGSAEPNRVVFMGDSITQSWLFGDSALFGPATVNRGISGQTTPQMLLRFRADVLGLKPRAVHIMAGVNDIAGNTGPTTIEDIESNIASMVELAKAHNVTVILATVLPAATFTWAPQFKPAPSVAKLNAWIHAYAAEQNLVVANYFPAMATPDGAMKPELTLDGVHPNKAGYAVMAPITRAAMQEALAR